MRILDTLDNLPEAFRGGAVAIGNFDGVHKGHRAVIGEAGHVARANDIPWLVLTFEPHPRSVFAPKGAPFRLTPNATKARHIRELGVDCLVVLPFDIEFSRRAAESFVADVLVGGLGARHVVSGYDFIFGHGRHGNCELLLRLGAEMGFAFTSVSAEADAAGTTYSSSRIRELLQDGDPRGAEAILGRRYAVDGAVQDGDKRGRTIGFPTANVALGDHLRPAQGVYAIRAAIIGDDGGDTSLEWHDGVANFGNRPTFDGTDTLLEAHLFDFDRDLYGRPLRVEFVDFLRPERKFDGIDDLKRQIAADAVQARQILLETRQDPASAEIVRLNKQRALR